MKLRPLILASVAVCIVVILLYRGWLDPIRDITLKTTGPVARISADIVIGAAGTVRSFFRIGTLSRTVRNLEEENASLYARISQLSGLHEENQDLREELELLPRETFALLSADVIGRSIDAMHEVLFINRGTSDGIQPDMPVIAHEGAVVGKIHEVTSSTASIILITDPSSRVAARIQESNDAQGVVRGMRGLDVVMESVPRTAEVSAGSFIVTTGEDGIYPPDLFIGTVRSIDTAELEIFQTIQVAPKTNFYRLRVVSVIL